MVRPLNLIENNVILTKWGPQSVISNNFWESCENWPKIYLNSKNLSLQSKLKISVKILSKIMLIQTSFLLKTQIFNYHWYYAVFTKLAPHNMCLCLFLVMLALHISKESHHVTGIWMKSPMSSVLFSRGLCFTMCPGIRFYKLYQCPRVRFDSNLLHIHVYDTFNKLFVSDHV